MKKGRYISINEAEEDVVEKMEKIYRILQR
jgi:hypothetical protein